ncbi:hypothetical protein HDU99_010767 [Rhizoclosmatium hyalinum]|nr:hypothetical protein HDU99_010767 [Rhizoclosmatium hyalinum]
MMNVIRRSVSKKAPALTRSVFGLSRRQAAQQPTSIFNDPFFEPFNAVERQMINSFFGDVARPGFSTQLKTPNWSAVVTSIRWDVKETENSYVVNVDLPGLNKDEVNVSVKDNVLTISGEHKSSVEDKNEVRHIVERSSGSFSRSIVLPKDASAEEIKASMADGVLKLEITKVPVSPEEGIKKIPIA